MSLKTGAITAMPLTAEGSWRGGLEQGFRISAVTGPGFLFLARDKGTSLVQPLHLGPLFHKMESPDDEWVIS